MEWFSSTEQIKQESDEETVQMPEKPQKKRSQEEKVGRQKYHEVVTKRSARLLEQVLRELRWVRRGLIAAGYGKLDDSTIRKGFADQVDALIFDKVREVGVAGAFPKDVADWVNKQGSYGLRYYDVSRRIVRMNKRSHFETREFIFEKRGDKWALTSVAFES